MVIDNDTRALLESWNEVLEDLDGVLVALVVEDPSKEVDCATTLVRFVYHTIMQITNHQHP